MPLRLWLTYSGHPEQIPCIADRLEQAIDEGRGRNGTAVGELLRIQDAETMLEVWPRDERAEQIAAENAEEESHFEALKAYELAQKPGAQLAPAECAAVLAELERWIGAAGTLVTSSELDGELIYRLLVGAGDLYSGEFSAL